MCCLKRSNFLAPFDHKVLYNLGLIHLIMQQYASAFHYLSAWVHQSPHRGKTYMLLASNIKNCSQYCSKIYFSVALWELQAVDAAKVLFEQAARVDAKDPLVALNLAIFVFNTTKEPDLISTYLRDFQDRMQNMQATTGTFVEDEVNRPFIFLKYSFKFNIL